MFCSPLVAMIHTHAIPNDGTLTGASSWISIRSNYLQRFSGRQGWRELLLEEGLSLNILSGLISL